MPFPTDDICSQDLQQDDSVRTFLTDDIRDQKDDMKSAVRITTAAVTIRVANDVLSSVHGLGNRAQ